MSATIAGPRRHGLTGPGALLGGGLPVYAVYDTADRPIALAALEPHFTARLLEVLGIAPEELSRERLAEVFAGRTADEWATWAAEHDVPLAPFAPPDRPVARPRLRISLGK